MTQFKGSPAYWKKFMKYVMATVKQLGMSTFFLTLSCADLLRNELVSIISKINGIENLNKETSELNYQE